jgi:hypothetical protein
MFILVIFKFISLGSFGATFQVRWPNWQGVVLRIRRMQVRVLYVLIKHNFYV